MSSKCTYIGNTKKCITPPKAILKISDYVWSKLHWMMRNVDTEISGFGITDKDDPLYIVDFETVKQTCTSTNTDMDKDDISRFTDKKIDEDYDPVQFMRIWIHTHPTFSTNPSTVDEETFNDVFGSCKWAVMLIINKKGESYCALQYNQKPKHRVKIDVEIVWDTFNSEWKEELENNVKEDVGTISNYGYNGWHYDNYIEDIKSRQENKKNYLQTLDSRSRNFKIDRKTLCQYVWNDDDSDNYFDEDDAVIEIIEEDYDLNDYDWELDPEDLIGDIDESSGKI